MKGACVKRAEAFASLVSSISFTKNEDNRKYLCYNASSVFIYPNTQIKAEHMRRVRQKRR